jgi:hypothetical protein
MLTTDIDHSNDKETLTVEVARYSLLHLEPDQADTVSNDSVSAYRFYAELESDSAKVIDLGQSELPPGWAAGFYDSAGVSPISGTLGLVQPGRKYWFSLVVTAPASDLAGVSDTLAYETFLVRAWARVDTLTRDSAILMLKLEPLLTVHSFPNPCYGSTRFIIGVPMPGSVSLVLYNRAGEHVRTLLERSEILAGVKFVDWDGTNDAGLPAASGSYRYVLDYTRGGVNRSVVNKLVLLRR